MLAARHGCAARLDARGAAVVVYGVVLHGDPRELRAASTTSCTFRGDSHARARARARRPGGRRRALRCGPVSVPNHKLIPDVRWILDRTDVGRARALQRARERRTRVPRTGARRRALRRRPRARCCARRSSTPADDPPTSLPLAGFGRAAHEPVLRRLCQLLSARCATATRARRRRARRAAALPAAATGPGWACSASRERLVWGAAVGALLLLAFLLRVWGVNHGLPYAYNADENAHFVPQGDRPLRARLEPALLRQPAGLHVPRCTSSSPSGSAAARASSDGLRHRPDRRSSSSRASPPRVLGTLAVWLLYLAGARLLRPPRRPARRRRCLAVAFLPVFYSHLALNDVPDAGADLPLAVGHRRRPAPRPHARLRRSPGSASGWPARRSTPAGSCCCRSSLRRSRSSRAAGGRAGASRGLAIVGRAWRCVAFVVANPYALLDFVAFRDGLDHQPSVAERCGQARAHRRTTASPTTCGRFTWGLGWVPLVAARRRRRAACSATSGGWSGCSSPAPIVFVLFMGSQERFFGRWLMPGLPDRLPAGRLRALRARRRARAPRAGAAADRASRSAVVLLCGQGLVSSLHIGQVLSRDDTRNLARDWMVANVPGDRRRSSSSRSSPTRWAQDIGNPSPLDRQRQPLGEVPDSSRWIARRRGQPVPGAGRHREHRGLRADAAPRARRPLRDAGLLLGRRGLHAARPRRGRARGGAAALAYYRELERRADVVYDASPYRAAQGPGRVQLRLVASTTTRWPTTARARS